MEYKFEIGDQVKIIESGDGCGRGVLGEIVTILEKGIYISIPGYKISDTTKPNTNSMTGNYDGFCGETSFKLVTKGEPQYEIY